MIHFILGFLCEDRISCQLYMCEVLPESVRAVLLLILLSGLSSGTSVI